MIMERGLIFREHATLKCTRETHAQPMGDTGGFWKDGMPGLRLEENVILKNIAEGRDG